jgi:hypothetical protein
VTRRRRLAVGLGLAAIVLAALAGVFTRIYGEYLNSPHYNRRELPIDSYTELGPTQLQISVHTGAQDIVEEPRVHESADRITIDAWVSEYNPGSGFKNLARYDFKLTISLTAPVGQRVVHDSATGRPVPKS